MRAVAALAWVLALVTALGPARAQGLRLLSPLPDAPTHTPSGSSPPIRAGTEGAAVELALRSTRPFVNVLGRVDAAGTRVSVNDEIVPVYGSGVFVRDRLPLQMGMNRIVLHARDAQGQEQRLEFQVTREEPPAPAAPRTGLWIDAASIQPRATWRVPPGEAVQASVQASPGQRVQVRWALVDDWHDMTEGPQPGQYSMALKLPPQAAADALAPLEFRLLDAASASTSSRQRVVRQSGTSKVARHKPKVFAAVRGEADVGPWPAEPPLFVAVPDGADLLHGVHEVRLGGPFLAELPEGTLLAVEAQLGAHYRLRLSPQQTAFVTTRSLVPAPAGSRRPHAYFSSLQVQGGPEGDRVLVPLPPGLPYAVRARVDGQARAEVQLDLFGAHDASTWLSHSQSARLVHELQAEQIGPGHLRLRAVLRSPQLWGWRVQRVPQGLWLRISAPPPLAPAPASPLQGLTIALEAGHGSAANLGAVGATGVPEKDINLWTTQALKAELEARGVRVLMVREGDENPNLRERARRAQASGAQLFISVHANAADTSNGYLRVGGTSMFYKHPHSRDLAQAIQQRMLQATGLPDFGRVGNFNYAPTRLLSGMPAVLVEQAFMSNPQEEALLLEPAFRQRIAQAIRLGLEDFLNGWR
jgi:N-acetylmuramoyl-L-alanine amidase